MIAGVNLTIENRNTKEKIEKNKEIFSACPTSKGWRKKILKMSFFGASRNMEF